MRSAVKREAETSDAVIMAAAISDYRVENASETKIKKSDNDGGVTLTLVENPDILKEIAGSKTPGQVIIGFAAETASGEELLTIAREKIQRKGCDLLVVNQVGWDQGFGTESNAVTVIGSRGDILDNAAGTKLSVADTILDCITTKPFQNA